MVLRGYTSNTKYPVGDSSPKAQSEVALRVEELTRLRSGHPVVQSISFSLMQGEVVGLLGANGAGKTTTLRMIAQVLKPHAGSVEIVGLDPRSSRAKAMKSLGYLPQQPPLYDELTVAEQLAFVAELMGVKAIQRKAALERVIHLCDLSSVTKMLCSHLSTGYRKRVGIAGALIHSPKVILLDEPFTGLDPIQRKSLRETLVNLGKSHAILLSTHLLSEVSHLCTRVLVMADGVLRADMEVNSSLSSMELELCFLEAVGGEVDCFSQHQDKDEYQEFAMVGNQ
jgi:ABC-2 type transport system ATP-binding protein